MGAGEGRDHRPFHQANGTGIPGGSEGIYCGILQRTLEQGGHYHFKTSYLPPHNREIKLYLPPDFFLFLLLFIIPYKRAESSVRSQTVALNARGFD